jgi:23S rRNA (adenine2503-C2)-methyltransferase
MDVTAAQDPATNLLGLEFSEISEALAGLGAEPFRASQVAEWMYRKRVMRFDDMSNLGRELRQRLSERFSLRSLTLARTQGSADSATRKLLFRLRDQRFIEAVVIPANPALYGDKSDRHTLCVSTQVGCAMDCKFCASGLNGLTRNLDAAEIVEQVVAAEEVAGERMDNLVFMGMGEPLANYRNVMKAIRILNASWGLRIGARHITVSTSGLVPQIQRLAGEPLQIRLAVSLHGATDEVRETLMPVNRKYPLAALTEALLEFSARKKQTLTLEFILIAGVNDTLDQAERLSELARRIRAKVNLIPYNTVEGLQWARPSEDQQNRFAAVLRRHRVTATLRREKGHDIEAACGQLRLREESSGSAA